MRKLFKRLDPKTLMTAKCKQGNRASTFRQGLDKAAERPGLTVFLVALSVRLALAAVVSVRSDGSMFLDDGFYLSLTTWWAANGGIGNLDPDSQEFYRTHVSFLGPIGVLFRMFGAKPILAQAISAVAGAATAACVVTIARRHTRPKIALAAGLLAALFPSQVLWSSLVLKDSAVWMALSGLAVAFGWWTRFTDRRRFLTGLVVISGLMIYLVHLRIHTLLVASLALVIASAMSSNPFRAARTMAAVALLVIVPTFSAAGPAGHVLWKVGLTGLADQRVAGAEGALTAISRARAQRLADQRAAGGEGALDEAAALQQSDGGALDEAAALQQSDGGAATFTADLMYLPTGIRVMLIDPLPTHLNRSPRMRPAFAEHLIWYPTVLLAMWGLWRLRGLRSRSPDLVYVLVTSLGLIAMWALVEGNFGTAYRHRGEFVWAALIFAAIGTEDLLDRRKFRAKPSKQEPL